MPGSVGRFNRQTFKDYDRLYLETYYEIQSLNERLNLGANNSPAF